MMSCVNVKFIITLGEIFEFVFVCEMRLHTLDLHYYMSFQFTRLNQRVIEYILALPVFTETKVYITLIIKIKIQNHF